MIAIRDGQRTVTYEVVRVVEKARFTDKELNPQVIKAPEESL